MGCSVRPVQTALPSYCRGTNIRWKDGVNSYSYAYGADWTFSKEIVQQRLKVKREKLISYLRLKIKQNEAKIAKLMRLQ